LSIKAKGRILAAIVILINESNLSNLTHKSGFSYQNLTTVKNTFLLFKYSKLIYSTITAQTPSLYQSLFIHDTFGNDK